jgi:hypothetical protein
MMMNIKQLLCLPLLFGASLNVSALIIEEGFESATHGFLNSGNPPVVVQAADARDGSYVMKSQLTPDTNNPERTEVSLRTKPTSQTNLWNFDVDQDYWVGISIKLDEDFNVGDFDDQGMLLQWHYYDWKHGDSYKPQPLIIRYLGGEGGQEKM